jgi:surfeit locus 1 family protein
MPGVPSAGRASPAASPAGGATPAAAAGRGLGKAVALLGAGGLTVLVLLGLGTWQLHRLSWKLDLIASVDARVRAAPVAPPGPAAWPGVSAEADQYRHVALRGVFENGRETFVQAVTEAGAGFWVLTPLRADAGFTVLVNRGFVPGDRRDPATRPAGQPAGETAVTGLLRVTEPGGAFLRHNDPAADRWYSRDVAAIAAKRGLTGPVAPYFIDADATPNPGGLPVGGLTVIAFPNNHLVYAITWYALALMLAGALAWAVREERRARRRPGPAAPAG